ncbi:helix-turn-helix transcriptional regulator [Bremerella cremea]|nr:helix-turn-helix transcriptional regulator [Bremerella cremea]
MKFFYQQRTVESFDPDVLMDVVANTGFEQRLLKGGPFAGQLMRICLPNCRIDKGYYSLPCFARGSATADCVMVGMTFTSGQTAWVNGKEAFFDDFQLYAENAAVDYRTVAGAPWVALQMSREWLQLQAIKFSGREINYPPTSVQNVVVSRWAALKLRTEIESLLQCNRRFSIEHMTQVAAQYEQSIVRALVEAISAAGPDQVVIRRQTERKKAFMESVEQYLGGHLADPIRIQDLVNHTGLHERSLQRFSQEVYGLTPKQLFGVVRLNRIRRELLCRTNLAATIRQITEKWGIRHQGRFAAHYEELFGEKPSETLQRSLVGAK